MHSRTDYYEAIIQFRPHNEEAFRLIKKWLPKKNAKISKIVWHKTGSDIYLTKNNAARSLCNKLRKVFNCNLTLSKKIVTRQASTGKDLYRGIIAVRFKSSSPLPP